MAITEITLGDRKFGIRPLTLRQLIEVEAISVSGTTNRDLDKTRQAAVAAALANASDPAAATAAAAKAAAAVAEEQAADVDAEVFVRRNQDRIVRTIEAALSRDFPDMTADRIMELEVAPRELAAPYLMILKLSGLVIAGEAAGNL